jgi:hypothetical protein
MFKPFSFRFRIWCSEFGTEFKFVQKYEFDQIKCRKQCGLVQDVSVPFSSLATIGRSADLPMIGGPCLHLLEGVPMCHSEGWVLLSR